MRYLARHVFEEREIVGGVWANPKLNAVSLEHHANPNVGHNEVHNNAAHKSLHCFVRT
jgi:hypothetical protein